MAIHVLEREKRPVARLYPVTEIVSGPKGETHIALIAGATGATIVMGTGTVAGTGSSMQVVEFNWLSYATNATNSVSLGGLYYGGGSGGVYTAGVVSAEYHAGTGGPVTGAGEAVRLNETAPPDGEDYNPEMVERVLKLAADEPEAKFDNVVDMMDWLERE